VLKVPFVTNYLSEHFGDDDFRTLKGYKRAGGYEAARKAFREMSPVEVIDLVKASGLQGRGGAGFLSGLKFSFMPQKTELPKYLVCNADESEPGSFKDRYDGGVLGEDVMGTGFRHDVVVVRGAGAYICGEETGLLESLEGKKGQPRKKPPFPAEYGAFGMPSTVNNVETFSHLPHIVGKGVDWFHSIGTEKSPGTTIFGVSGHVVRPGLYELPLGTRLDEIVFEHAGGVPNGRKVKGVIPGGVSMPILPAGQLDVPMANEFLRERQTLLGTGGIVVMDETTCMVRVASVISYFYRDESCGQCTQCREGTAWINKIVDRIERGDGRPEDLETLLDVAGKLEGHTICAFAEASAWPIQGLLRHFRGDFEAHIREKKCPMTESFEL
jgi:NADH-quinone oxidoreductase subunit F